MRKTSKAHCSIPIRCGVTIEDIYRYPLRQTAVDTLNRQLRSSISDEALAQLVIALRDDDRLCIMHKEDGTPRAAHYLLYGLMNAENAKGRENYD